MWSKPHLLHNRSVGGLSLFFWEEGGFLWALLTSFIGQALKKEGERIFVHEQRHCKDLFQSSYGCFGMRYRNESIQNTVYTT